MIHKIIFGLRERERREERRLIVICLVRREEREKIKSGEKIFL